MPSLASSLVSLALIAYTSAHLSLINIYGSNNLVGHGFGVNLYGKYPRARGEPGDAGGDSGVFETGTDNPSPVCGSTPELGPVDVGAWMGQAEGDGLPSAYANMSVVVEAFQVNRDGGGPMSCEYSEDASTTSWKPMFMTLNQAGNSGIQNQLRSNMTVVMNFPSDAKCTGGWTQTACIVRCRTGVNKRFGGCFAVKLNESSQPGLVMSASVDSNDTPTVARPIDNERTAKATNTDLSDEQIGQIAHQVIMQMKNDGLVFASSTNSTEALSIDSGPSEPEKSDLPISRSVDLDKSAVDNLAPETPDVGRNQENKAILSPENSASTHVPPRTANKQVTNNREKKLNVADNSVMVVSGTEDQLRENSTPVGSYVVSKNSAADASDRAAQDSNNTFPNANQTASFNQSAIVGNQRLVNTTKLALATSCHGRSKHAHNSTTRGHQNSEGPAILAIHAVDNPSPNSVPDPSHSVADNSTLDASDIADNQLYNHTELSPDTPLPSTNQTIRSKKHVSSCRINRKHPGKKNPTSGSEHSET